VIVVSVVALVIVMVAEIPDADSGCSPTGMVAIPHRGIPHQSGPDIRD
jgi:hypothetical protein